MSSYQAPPASGPGPSVDFILSRHAFLQQIYAQRNGEYAILRKVFDGDFASIQQDKTQPTLFNDRIKIVIASGGNTKTGTFHVTLET